MLPTVLAGLGLGFSLIVAIGAQNLFVLRQGLRREHVFAVAAICAVSDAVLIVLGVSGIGLVLQAVPWLVDVVRWAGAAFLVVYGLLAARRAWRPSGEALVAANGDTAESESGASDRETPGTGIPAHHAPVSAPMSARPGPAIPLDSRGRILHARPSIATAQAGNDSASGPQQETASRVAPRRDRADARGTSEARVRSRLVPVVLTCLALTWLNPHVYLDTVFLLGTVANTHGTARWLFAAGAVTASVVWFFGLAFGARLLGRWLATPRAWRILDAVIAVVMIALGISLVLPH